MAGTMEMGRESKGETKGRAIKEGDKRQDCSKMCDLNKIYHDKGVGVDLPVGREI